MATSIVKVYNSRQGRWESGARVVLEWTGIVNLGQSNAVKTNLNGIAVVNHSSTGNAIVYVNGRNMGRMKTPGEHLITIS